VKHLKFIENPESPAFSQLSREMRISLEGIIGFTHLLASPDSGLLNEKQSRYVSEIFENGRQLGSLISDYIDLAKIESGLLDLNYAPLNLNECVVSSLARVHEAMAAKKAKFTLLWNTPDQEIWGDESRIKQILEIMLRTIHQFAYEGERIVITVSSSDKNINLEFKGHSPKTDSLEERELYEQLEEFQGKRDIGLALALKLIQLHGGQMGLEKEEKGESGLWFSLPKEKNYLTNAGSLDQNSVMKPHRFLRVLIVDDSLSIRNLVVEILKREHYKVFVADNGMEAVRLAGKCHPDLILMDINMPVMDGKESIQALRALPGLSSTPVVALTGYDFEGSFEELASLGFTHYISKPFDRSELLTSIKNYISSG
ncbi:response regulator, partial [Candidatus Saccharibacteria bacterium]|nr:response regulator [Candidatus Saccharibacteria bacterium]NIW77998.1 response regulator [Calditrichia bacterium]